MSCNPDDVRIGDFYRVHTIHGPELCIILGRVVQVDGTVLWKMHMQTEHGQRYIWEAYLLRTDDLIARCE